MESVYGIRFFFGFGFGFGVGFEKLPLNQQTSSYADGSTLYTICGLTTEHVWPLKHAAPSLKSFVPRFSQ